MPEPLDYIAPAVAAVSSAGIVAVLGRKGHAAATDKTLVATADMVVDMLTDELARVAAVADDRLNIIRGLEAQLEVKET